MPQRSPALSRRDVLKLLTLGSGAWFLGACGRTLPDEQVLPTATQKPNPASSPLPTPHPSPTSLPAPPRSKGLPADFQAGRITPIGDFYVQSYNRVPLVDPSAWRLSLDGLFERPLELDLPGLRGRPEREIMHTLECIGNPVGGNLIGNAIWAGIPLRSLLDEAGLLPEAAFLHFSSADGYQTSIPAALALDERSTLVHRMNGETLPAEHGGPARLILPGVYGQKQPKWIVAITAAERDSPGTWEKKGWSNTAVIQINSRVEAPRLRQRIPAGQPFYALGTAMADTSGVSMVEVSPDDGVTWQTAALLPGPDVNVWTLWYWIWEDPPPGKHALLARATDGNGATQSKSGIAGILDNVFPNGTSMMQRVLVEVV